MRIHLIGPLLLSLASASPERPKLFQVETRRIPSEASTMIRENRREELMAQLKMRATYDFDINVQHQQPLKSYFDRCYVGEIKLGTPPQSFWVQMDTSSADLWVIDARCYDQYEKDCKGTADSGYSRNRFDPRSSSTFMNGSRIFSENYDGDTPGNWGVQGYLGYDVIDLAGMKFNSQGLGVATQITSNWVQLDGILGLGFPALTTSGLTPPLQNLLDQMDQPIFTVFMSRNQNVQTGAVDGGRITFGGFDKENCDEKINYVPLNSLLYWQFKMDDFTIGKYQAKKSYPTVIIDTSSSFIGAPMDARNAIVNEIQGAKFDSGLQLYYVDCKGKYPDLVLKIGGIDYKLPSFEYVLDLGITPAGTCVLGIVVAPQMGNPTWILGDVFIRQFCTVHDVGNSRIGFARSINQDNGSGSKSSLLMLVVAMFATRLLQ